MPDTPEVTTEEPAHESLETLCKRLINNSAALYQRGAVPDCIVVDMREAAARLRALEAENKRLREGLKPFAEAADDLDEGARDKDDCWESSAAMGVTAGDFRRAKAAFSLAGNPVSLAGIWQQARENHKKYSATGSGEEDIRFLALGLVGEAGEVANFVKKRWRDSEPHTEALQKECADVLAYTMMLADALGMTPETLIEMVAHKQQVFIEKMKARDAARASISGEG